MKKIGRPKLPITTEKKSVVSGYISESVFKKVAMLAIKNKKTVSKTIGDLIEKGLGEGGEKANG